VIGPGVVHGLAGLADAQQNCWPMIRIGRASETYRRGMGAFQEERQVLLAAPLCKFAHAIDSVKRIPYCVAEATRNAIYGRPGAAYLDMPDDIITGKCDEKDVVFLMGARFNWIFHFGQPPRYAPDVKVIQLDIAPEEIGHNKATDVALVGPRVGQ
jgi:thiamine pyrophosphate-dependent acetolactate synthase large subunit-like protein